MFAGEAGILFTHSNTTKLNSSTHTVFETINTWFKSNYHSLNFEKNKKKTHCIHCQTRSSPVTDMNICYNNKLIPNVLSTKFLGLTTDSTLMRRTHIDHLTTKLSTAYYVIRSIKPLTSQYELQNNILGTFLSQYTNLSDVKDSNQNY